MGSRLTGGRSGLEFAERLWVSVSSSYSQLPPNLP